MNSVFIKSFLIATNLFFLIIAVPAASSGDSILLEKIREKRAAEEEAFQRSLRDRSHQLQEQSELQKEREQAERKKTIERTRQFVSALEEFDWTISNSAGTEASKALNLGRRWLVQARARCNGIRLSCRITGINDVGRNSLGEQLFQICTETFYQGRSGSSGCHTITCGVNKTVHSSTSYEAYCQ